jgi:hypothetical protein
MLKTRFRIPPWIQIASNIWVVEDVECFSILMYLQPIFLKNEALFYTNRVLYAIFFTKENKKRVIIIFSDIHGLSSKT